MMMMMMVVVVVVGGGGTAFDFHADKDYLYLVSSEAGRRVMTMMMMMV